MLLGMWCFCRVSSTKPCGMDIGVGQVQPLDSQISSCLMGFMDDMGDNASMFEAVGNLSAQMCPYNRSGGQTLSDAA